MITQTYPEKDKIFCALQELPGEPRCLNARVADCDADKVEGDNVSVNLHVTYLYIWHQWCVGCKAAVEKNVSKQKYVNDLPYLCIGKSRYLSPRVQAGIQLLFQVCLLYTTKAFHLKIPESVCQNTQ